MVGGRYGLQAVVWLAALTATAAFASPIFNVSGFITPDAFQSSSSAINASALIAGTSTRADGTSVAFLAGPSGTQQLAPLGGGFSSAASGINAAGTVAGTTYSDSGAQATLWTVAGSVGLGTLGGSNSYATDVNARGVVVGGAATASGALHAYAYDGTMRDLGTLSGGTWSSAYAVNAAGQVVGYGDNGSGAFLAFLWTTTGGMTELGTLGGRSSYAMDISDNGTVVGNAQISSGYLHAFLYSGGQMNDLGTLGGGNSYAYDVNNLGQVVGYSNVAGSDLTHAFLFANGTMRDLNTMIVSDSGWILTEAYGINDAGQITGTGIYNGEQRAFLLDWDSSIDGPLAPILSDGRTIENPEPSSLTLIMLGAGLLLLPQLVRKIKSYRNR